jgi:transposase
MLNARTWSTIKTLYKEGYGKKAIARMLGISRNTVRRALASQNPPEYKRTKRKDSELDPYREKIHTMYCEQKFIGVRIYNELVSQGYTGSIATLYRYLNKIKKKE